MTMESFLEGKKVDPYVPFPTFDEWSRVDFDLTTVSSYQLDLDAAKATATSEALDDMLGVASRWAAASTGAIEGLYELDRGVTITIARTAAAWNQAEAVTSPEAATLMRDQLAGYDYVLDATTKNTEITEYWVKELHRVICTSQKTYRVYSPPVGWQDRHLELGAYKTEPNNPYNIESETIHGYADPLEVVAEMGRLMSELRTDEFKKAHPVRQAAYAHYAFVCIHPFADGNGRVSRAFASVFLYRRPGMPLVIFADQKPGYIAALEAADKGDPAAFLRYIADRVMDAAGMMTQQLATSLLPSITAQLEKARAIMTGRGGLTHTELDALAWRLEEEWAQALDEAIADEPVTLPYTAQRVDQIGASRDTGRGYRLALRPNNPNPVVALNIHSPAPMQAYIQRSYFAEIAKPEERDLPDIVIVSESRPVIEIRLSEAHPAISTALSFKLKTVALAEYRRAFSDALAAGTAWLQQEGYNTTPAGTPQL
jgi:Fic family protein